MVNKDILWIWTSSLSRQTSRGSKSRAPFLVIKNLPQCTFLLILMWWNDEYACAWRRYPIVFHATHTVNIYNKNLPILSPLFVAVSMYPAVPCDFKVSRQHKEFYYQRYAIIEGDDNSAQSGPRSTQTAKGFMGVSEVAFKF